MHTTKSMDVHCDDIFHSAVALLSKDDLFVDLLCSTVSSAN